MIKCELKGINLSAVNSLEEGFEWWKAYRLTSAVNLSNRWD
jgi:hypothetical protein